MLQKKAVMECLAEFCESNKIPIERANSQLHAIGKDIAILCVEDPDAPAPDGLANDIETLMLPTLYIHKTDNGLQIEETQYTDKYLKAAG